MADAIRPGANIDRFREQQIQQTAIHSGNAARHGAKEHRETLPGDEGPARVVRYEELAEGRRQMHLSDGRSITRAANGVLREEDPEGNLAISLPNGILITRSADGQVSGYDPESGRTLDVKAHQLHHRGEYHFKFEDGGGRRYETSSESLGFEVSNHTNTVHQRVHSTGSMNISTSTPYRDPDTGRFREDTEHFWVESDGKVHNRSARSKHAQIDNQGLHFTEHGDLNLDLDLPYPIPFALHGPSVRPQPAEPPPATPAPDPAPPAQGPVPSPPPPVTLPSEPDPAPAPPTGGPAPAPPQANPTPAPPTAGPAPAPPQADPTPAPDPGPAPPPGMPGGTLPPPGMPGGTYPPPGMPGGTLPPPGMPGGQPGFPGSWPGGFNPTAPPYAGGGPWNAPWAMPPFQSPAPTGPVPLPADPYATVSTAGGVIRQAQPDGSMFISLPDSIVVQRYANGQTQVFDARAGQPLPAQVTNVVTPGGGPEQQITFRDAAGNDYLMFSRSLDFAVTSPDKSVREVVMPQGNILVLAQTPATGPDGKPTVRQHMAEIFPNGQVNTFGEPGVNVGLNGISFANPGGPPSALPLPYPVPMFEGMIQTMRGVNPQFPTATSGLLTTPGTTPPPPPTPPPAPMPGTPPVPSNVTDVAPTPSAAPPPPAPAGASTTPAAPAQPPAPASGASPSAPPSAAASAPQLTADQQAAVQSIMDQVAGFHPSPEVTARLRPLLEKVIARTATPDETAQAEALLQSVMSDGQPPATADASAASASQAAATDASSEAASPAPATDASPVAASQTAATDASPASASQASASDASTASQASASDAATTASQGQIAPEPAAAGASPSAVAAPAASSGAPALPPEQQAKLDYVMQAAQQSGTPPEVLAELRPLLEKVASGTASDSEKARAEQLLNAIGAGKYAPAGAVQAPTLADVSVAQQPPAAAAQQPPGAVISATQAPAPADSSAAQPPPTSAAAPDVGAEVPGAPAPALTPDQQQKVDAIMEQVGTFNPPPAVGTQLRSLLGKVVAQTATPEEAAQAESLLQAVLSGQQVPTPPPAADATAAPSADNGGLSAPVSPTNGSLSAAAIPAAADAPLPATAPSPPAASPVAQGASAPLNDQQKAAVNSIMKQVDAFHPPAEVKAELQPLLEKVALQTASPQEMARADAIIKGLMAGAKSAAGTGAAAPPAEASDPGAFQLRPPSAPFGIPHRATADELAMAAVGHPEYAYAANPPAEWIQSLQREHWEQAATQPAAAPPPTAPSPPAVAATPPPAAPDPSAAAPPPAAPPAQPLDAVPAPPPVPGGPSAPSSAGPAATASPDGAPSTAPSSAAATAPAAGGPAPNTQVQGPHQPGVWQRIKHFFMGDDHGPQSEPAASSWSNTWGMQSQAYPSHSFTRNTYAPYGAMQGMLAATMLGTTMSSMMMMPSMYYWSPFSMYGMGMGGFGMPGMYW